ncbi:BrnT family toxin [Photorhabdus khanii]|uniref:BrnT family toxin n=1 Tax=Photorhabdus khanii TaxID=1004150 RepID=UPI001EFFFFDB|nr:BrnT family toxin [Photorhabdus khanii]
MYLADAEYLDWGRMVAVSDSLGAYGEDRYIGITYGFAYLNNRIYVVVFTYSDDDDEEIYRIISLRKATKEEVQNYAKA